MKKYIAKAILGFVGFLFCSLVAAAVIVMPGMTPAFVLKWSLISGAAAFGLILAVTWAFENL